MGSGCRTQRSTPSIRPQTPTSPPCRLGLLAGLPGDQDITERDVCGGEWLGCAGGADLRGAGAQLFLPRQNGPCQRHRPLVAKQHPGSGERRHCRCARSGLVVEAASRHRTRTAPWRTVRGRAVLGLLRPEDRVRQAQRLQQEGAVRHLRVRAAAVPVGLRGERASGCWRERPRGNGGDHRRLCRSDDLSGRPAV
jgi:hypothetical protein